MKHLVIVESPNKIKSIEKYLGKDYIVKASVGHIVYLPSSGDHRFGVDLETWLPKYKVDPDKVNVVKDLKEASKKVDIVYVATDPDREGEAIADNLVTFLGIEDKYKRIRFNEITEKAIKAAIDNPTVVDAMLVKSQMARRILDRIIGYKLSQLMKAKITSSPIAPSAGRVQSIALKLVVAKEMEIDKFIKVPYVTLEAPLKDFPEVTVSYYNPANKDINKEWILPDDVEAIRSSLKGSMQVVAIETSVRKDAKHTPLKQAALYKKADSSYGLSAQNTQRAAQRLYEGYGDGGLISYPRTDSTRLSAGFVVEAQEYITSTYGKNYVSDEVKGSAGDQDAHEAIRPTDIALTPKMATAKFGLDGAEAKIYELIWTHTMQTLMTVPTRELIRYELEEAGHHFRMTSSKVLFDGYYKVAPASEKKELPKFLEKEVIAISSYNFENHETQPPARYNDGSLIEKLDNIGVGRPSTFATTVNILKDREYVEMEGRTLKPTEFGKIVLNKLVEAFPKIINEEYTANMEVNLDEISEGKHSYESLLNDFWEMFQEDLATATTEIQVTQMMPILAGKKCPVCGSELVVRRNKRDGTKFFGCSSYPECTHIESDPSEKPRYRKFFKK